MAMIKCPECGNDISDKAFNCPKCGCPVSSNENQVNPNTSNISDQDKTEKKVVIVNNGPSSNGFLIAVFWLCIGSILLYQPKFLDELFKTFISSITSETSETYIKHTKTSDFEAPAYCVPATVNQMRDSLKKNAINAQNTYKNNWYEISGLLGTIDSDGYYFYLEEGPALFTSFSIKCKIPREKRSMIINKLKEKHRGQKISVKGKVTDIGEIMGYEVTIVEVN